MKICIVEYDGTERIKELKTPVDWDASPLAAVENCFVEEDGRLVPIFIRILNSALMDYTRGLIREKHCRDGKVPLPADDMDPADFREYQNYFVHRNLKDAGRQFAAADQEK